ncbi:hypothetical protein GOODEAATRI_026620 [Goodea atripinnis]|uniref:Uncharacterized protein n=1 Tax=Goodea atripinnis TaxID=208336 RepID=A0ABV0MVJ9_9TELE
MSYFHSHAPYGVVTSTASPPLKLASDFSICLLTYTDLHSVKPFCTPLTLVLLSYMMKLSLLLLFFCILLSLSISADNSLYPFSKSLRADLIIQTLTKAVLSQHFAHCAVAGRNLVQFQLNYLQPRLFPEPM